MTRPDSLVVAVVAPRPTPTAKDGGVHDLMQRLAAIAA